MHASTLDVVGLGDDALRYDPRMASKEATTVDEYLATQPPKTARVLREVRATIKTALPDAEERISYGIPAYRVDGGIALFFAGWK